MEERIINLQGLSGISFGGACAWIRSPVEGQFVGRERTCLQTKDPCEIGVLLRGEALPKLILPPSVACWLSMTDYWFVWFPPPSPTPGPPYQLPQLPVLLG